MGISFLPTPSHRVFHYEPRYWNEKEEKLKERYAKYGKEYDPKKPWEGKVPEAEAKEAGAEQAEEPKNHLREGYVPGVLIRNAYRDGITSKRRKSTNTTLRTIIIVVSLALAFIAVYYFAEGLNLLLR